jgi:hypothetical protein
LAHLKDYYAILEVPRNAIPEKIKETYRRLTKEYHPDKNQSPVAEERFKLIDKAYQILSDPAKRAEYYALYGVMALRAFAPTALEAREHHITGYGLKFRIPEDQLEYILDTMCRWMAALFVLAYILTLAFRVMGFSSRLMSDPLQGFSNGLHLMFSQPSAIVFVEATVFVVFSLPALRPRSRPAPSILRGVGNLRSPAFRDLLRHSQVLRPVHRGSSPPLQYSPLRATF